MNKMTDTHPMTPQQRAAYFTQRAANANDVADELVQAGDHKNARIWRNLSALYTHDAAFAAKETI